MIMGLINKGIATLLNKPNPPPAPNAQTSPPPPAPVVSTTPAASRVGPKVAIINRSTVMTDAQLQPIVAALQIQLDRDFSPAWGISATLSFVGKSATAPSGVWQLIIQDTTNQQGALGYHELTTDGNPIGYVFAKTDIQNNLSVSVTISHELLEMLIDPDINLTAFIQTTNTAGTLYAYEVCDACEDDSFGYQINGILVSDFVYPAWFESFRRTGSTKFDFQGRITKPFQLLHGGYIGIFVVNKGTGWQQIFAEEAPANASARAIARNSKAQYSRANRRNRV